MKTLFLLSIFILPSLRCYSFDYRFDFFGRSEITFDVEQKSAGSRSPAESVSERKKRQIEAAQQRKKQKQQKIQHGHYVVPAAVADKNGNVAIGAVIAEVPTGDAEARNAENERMLQELKLNILGIPGRGDREQQGKYPNLKRNLDPAHVSAEIATFSIAMGAVTLGSAWIKAEGDPIALERHLLSIKDPIGHLSFYAFMLANGYYTDIRTAGYEMKLKSLNLPGDPRTRAQFMRRISYEGMAVGSLASSIVSDVGHTVQACADRWLQGGADDQTNAVCNEALRQWTVRNKFAQYFPQIINMWLSQKAAETLDSAARYGFNYVKNAQTVTKLLQTQAVKSAFKWTGLDLVTTFVGGKVASKVLRFTGKVTQISLFVSIDHLFVNTTNRIINNLLLPTYFSFDARSLNRSWLLAEDSQWDEAKMIAKTPSVCPEGSVDCFQEDRPESVTRDFIDQIEGFSESMKKWREHLNADSESDLAAWMEYTKKLLNQVAYAYDFYKEFLLHFFKLLNVSERVKNGKLQDSAMERVSGFPYRKLPFYGVLPGEYKVDGGMNINDLYLIRTNDLEQKQRDHILNTVKTFIEANLVFATKPQQLWATILSNLSSGKKQLMMDGLIEMNKILDGFHELENNNSLDLESAAFARALYKLRSALGNPQPVVYPFASFSQAYAANSVKNVVGENADFRLTSMSEEFSFNKSSDLMIHQMICGRIQGRVDTLTLADVNVVSPQFYPPSLLLESSDRNPFCRTLRGTYNLYSTPIAGISMTDYFNRNFDYSLLGDIGKDQDKEIFERWWLQNARNPIEKNFGNFDKNFQQLVVKASENFYGRSGIFKRTIDILNFSDYLPKNMNEALRFEITVNLQLINRALSFNPEFGKQSGAKKSDDDFLKKTIDSKNSGAFNPIAGTKVAEVDRLFQILSRYLELNLNKNVSFAQYLEHAKKVDLAINEVLVVSGLKKAQEVKGPAPDNEGAMDLADFGSASGTEKCSKIFTDIESAVKNPNFRQRVVLAGIKGIRQAESEIRRFIRMKFMLSKGLELDIEEFNKDVKSAVQGAGKGPRKANPWGGE